jgi:hypothetical protein
VNVSVGNGVSVGRGVSVGVKVSVGVAGGAVAVHVEVDVAVDSVTGVRDAVGAAGGRIAVQAGAPQPARAKRRDRRMSRFGMESLNSGHRCTQMNTDYLINNHETLP